jgi:geranylgeranyl diphosphate synthase type II
MNIIERYNAEFQNEIRKLVDGYLSEDLGKKQRQLLSREARAGSLERPALLLVSANIFGASRTLAVRTAAALKLTESWILMHDDMMDAITPDRSLASKINASDILAVSAWRAIRDCQARSGMKNGGSLIESYLDMLNRTLQGQSLDLAFRHSKDGLSCASVKFYCDIARLKTSCMAIYGPLQFGAILARAKHRTIECLKKIGEPVGIAYQIQDDANDLIELKKGRGRGWSQDLCEGKLTLPLLHAYQHAAVESKKRIDVIMRKAPEAKSKIDIDFLTRIIHDTEGLEYAAQFRKGLLADARRIYQKNIDKLPKSVDSRELFDFLTGAQ